MCIIDGRSVVKGFPVRARGEVFVAGTRRASAPQRTSTLSAPNSWKWGRDTRTAVSPPRLLPMGTEGGRAIYPRICSAEQRLWARKSQKHNPQSGNHQAFHTDMECLTARSTLELGLTSKSQKGANPRKTQKVLRHTGLAPTHELS